MSTPQPPVIDIDGLVADDAAALSRVADALRGPASALGLFHVTGHGIPDAELRAFDRTMRALFALPDAEKAAIRRTQDNAWVRRMAAFSASGR